MKPPFWVRFAAAAILVFMASWFVAAATQFNLTTQVQGILPVANGGTGGSSGPTQVFNTQSSASTGNIGATSMVASTSAMHNYLFAWSISLTVAGTSCTGSTTVIMNAIFTDPNASGSTTEILGIITIAYNGIGTVGFVASGVDNILAKTTTAVQYSTSSYTLGAGCTGTNPTYVVSPTLVQVW